MRRLIVAAALIGTLACVMVGSYVMSRAATPAAPVVALLTPRAYNTRGLAKLHQGDYGGALADFNQAIRLDPHFAAGYYNRGWVREYLRDYTGAVAGYTQALRYNPRDAASYYNRGLSRFYLNDYRGAIADYTQSIRLAPTNGAAYYNRALVREILKISQEPISLETPIGEEEDSHLGDFIEDAKAIAPSDAASHPNLGESSGDSGQP